MPEVQGRFVSREPDNRSARTLKDLKFSCILYFRLSLVLHNSKITQILYSTCLLLSAHGAIKVTDKLYGLQQNEYLSQVLSLPTSVKEIAKLSEEIA